MRLKMIFATLLALASCSTASSQSDEAAPGLAIGDKAPAFSLADQNGGTVSLESLQKSKKLTAVVFYRSADW